MTWARPGPAEVWQAVEAYLEVAYEGPPPKAVAERLARLRATADEAFYECDVFEPSADRYALRLGNRHYPHMKLLVEASPTRQALFRADTHDRHFLELLGPAAAGLEELMARNEAIARAIEEAWSARGLPTVREYWRDEMARWRAARPS